MTTDMGLVGLAIFSLHFETGTLKASNRIMIMRAGRTAVFGFQGRICFTCPALSV